MRSNTSASEYDVESAAVDTHLRNDTVHTFAWKSVSVSIYDKNVKGDKHVLSGIDGSVKAGKRVTTWCIEGHRALTCAHNSSLSY